MKCGFPSGYDETNSTAVDALAVVTAGNAGVN